MSGGTRIASKDAAAVAKHFLSLIEGTTERIAVAGSLRRRLPMCGDVEIVTIPRVTIEQTVFTDLLEDRVETAEVDNLHEALNVLLASGAVQKKLIGAKGVTRWGPRSKALIFEGVPFDIYSTDADIWGWTLVLRTGPAEFTKQLVQRRGEKTVDRRPGLLPEGLYFEGGIRSRLSGLLIPTPEEEDLFRVLGLEYREPWLRR